MDRIDLALVSYYGREEAPSNLCPLYWATGDLQCLILDFFQQNAVGTKAKKGSPSPWVLRRKLISTCIFNFLVPQTHFLHFLKSDEILIHPQFPAPAGDAVERWRWSSHLQNKWLVLRSPNLLHVAWGETKGTLFACF